MKYLKQFGIIIGFSFVGEILNHLIPLPIPASIYGIVLLFLALELKILPVEAMRETGKFLVAIMPIMFIPAAVGLIDSWGMIRESLVAYVVVTVVTTVLVMGVSGLVTQAVIRLKKGKEENHHA
ncbi:MAG: CidA/LrgA family protein [Roseburia sp.]